MDFARSAGLVLAIPILLILLAAALVVRRSRRPSLDKRFGSINSAAFKTARPPLPAIPMHLCPGCAMPDAGCVCRMGREAQNRSLERYYRRLGLVPDPEPGSFTNCPKCGMSHAPGTEHAR
jgi:hypothetical protein